MTKFFGALIVVAVVAVSWYVYQGNAQAPTTLDTGETVEDVMMEGDMGPDVMMEDIPAMEDSMMDEMEDMMSETKTFNLTGKNFAFSQKEIRVKKGDTVTINFESTNGFHDWTVDEFNAKTQQVEVGTKTSVTFVADKVGTFEYYCSVGSHRQAGMVGILAVEE
jgi:plastocyanin